MLDIELEKYWNDIPIGKQNAVSYITLSFLWGFTFRKVRRILHDLSGYDNGDNYILIRSSRSEGFYKTDNPETIKAYYKECLNKGKSIFAPLKKIRRITTADSGQYTFGNNLRVVRLSRNLKQGEVCDQMKEYDSQFDISLLSKMENGVCLPTPYQLSMLAMIYECETSELINYLLY